MREVVCDGVAVGLIVNEGVCEGVCGAVADCDAPADHVRDGVMGGVSEGEAVAVAEHGLSKVLRPVELHAPGQGHSTGGESPPGQIKPNMHRVPASEVAPSKQANPGLT